MAIKSFNVDEGVYNKFSSFCKDNGFSMSGQVQIFMESIIEEDPQVREEYIKKLERIRKGKFIRVDLAKRYGLKE